jgi:hypothetical protein
MKSTEYVVTCRVCNPLLVDDGHAFPTEDERSRWGNTHRDETGHDHWLLATYTDGQPTLVVDLHAGAVTELVSRGHPEAATPWPARENLEPE